MAHSPSGCAILCIAVGEIPIGIDTLEPRIVVDKSLLETSRRHLGLILNLHYQNVMFIGNKIIFTQNYLVTLRHYGNLLR